MRLIQWILGTGCLIGLLYLFALNSHTVSLYLIPGRDPVIIGLHFILSVAVAIGYVVGVLYYWAGTFHRHFSIRRTERTLKKEIDSLHRTVDSLEIQTIAQAGSSSDHLPTKE